MTFYFYFSSPKEINEVTDVYSQIIEESLVELGHSVKRTQKLKDIPTRSAVITIVDKDCALLHLLKKPILSICWYQGIIPEEAMLTFKGHWSAPLRARFHEFLEKYTLQKNDLNIFVSKAQENHYNKKYRISGKLSFIMPCYNTQINKDSFCAEKYNTPSFVYAGSMAAWQCVSKMLEVYKEIKVSIPSATLTIFTSQREIAQELVHRAGISAIIDYCAPDMLNARLSEFKYGFIIRDNIKVNQVATPTKINTYMAAGIIPIFSDVVEDYRDNITKLNPFVISKSDNQALVDAVIRFEKTAIVSQEVYKYHANIFNNYWNRDLYKRNLKMVVTELIGSQNFKQEYSLD